MIEHTIRYMVLRDQRTREESASLVSLAPRTDGALQLSGLPGIATGAVIQLPAPFNTDLPAPFRTDLSGVVCGKDRTTYSTDTDEGRLIIAQCACGDYEVISAPSDAGQMAGFKLPRGLLVLDGQLLVADSGNSRVLVLGLPSLRKHGEWTTALQTPACLAADRAGRVYVLDTGKKQVLRFSGSGEIDKSFTVDVTDAVCIAIDARDSLYVSDATSIRRFDTGEIVLDDLTLPTTTLKPRAMAAHGTRLYVADAESGFIWAYETSKKTWLGALASYRGPVAALAIDESGALYVKPGADDTVYRLDADAARVRSGSLSLGTLNAPVPVDAGEGEIWERLWIEADIPAETEVVLEVAVSNDSSAPLSELVWKTSPSLDVLLRTLVDSSAARYLWLRITLKSLDGRSTPTLLQVQGATAAPSYLDYLPAIYRRDDAATGFLERWLALFRSELGDWERALEELPRQFDAHTVAEADIGNLAAWIALELPGRLDAPEQRQLLADAPALYRRRGTPAGIREIVRRNLGATIHIFEAFRERHVWQLGEGAGLGLGTALAAGTPDGLIVPGDTYADIALAGLRGDYYQGTKFEILRYTRLDPVVNFAWGEFSPFQITPLPNATFVPGQETFPANIFSVRWSGQVRPRYDETYTFRTKTDDGVRLWVGGRLIIDNWTDHGLTEDAGQIKLETGRWYPIVLEFYENAGWASIDMRWSSASQRSEIVPQECLYSVLDATAEFATVDSGGCGLLEVGQAVVGEGRPQAAEDFGAPLADDYAHLFTVVVAAAQVPFESQRQALRDLIEAERPAHTDFSLCLVEPRMRVGVQARLGIDSIVAGAGPAMRLGEVELGSDSYLGGDSMASQPSVQDAAHG